MEPERDGGPDGLPVPWSTASESRHSTCRATRIRPIAIFDIAHYMLNPACVNQAGTGCVVRVANIVGFFVEGMCDDVRTAGGSTRAWTARRIPKGKKKSSDGS